MTHPSSHPTAPTPGLGIAHLRTACTLLLAPALGSCGDGSPLLFSPPATAVPMASGIISGAVGDPVSPVPVIRVLDDRGNPVPGVPVHFRVEGGDGTVGGPSAISDERGAARPGSWTLGERPGMNVLMAEPQGTAPLELQALAAPGSPATSEPLSESSQSANVGRAVQDPPQVQVRDRFGNPVPGVMVGFYVIMGQGELQRSSAQTDGNGVASAGEWTLGLLPGLNRVETQVAGTSPVVFSAEAVLPAEFNISIQDVHLNQGGHSFDRGVGGVAGRAGLLRVVVQANSPNGFEPEVRVRLRSEEGVLREVTLPAPTAGVPQRPDLTNATHTWNLPLAAHEVVPGLSVDVEVDPDGTIEMATREDNLFPRENGTWSLDVIPLAPLHVTFFPIELLADGGITGAVHPGNTHTFLEATRKWIPNSTVTATVRPAYSFGLTLRDRFNWGTLLSEIQALRVADGAIDEYYHGIVPNFQGMALGGIAYRPSAPGSPFRSGLSHDRHPSSTAIVAHELGHNLGRRHTPCGNPANVDLAYPHSGARIGPPSWDVEGDSLVVDGELRDYMSYCSPQWTSDYTYRGILEWRRQDPLAQAPVGQGPTATAPSSPSGGKESGLLVWGRIDSEGVHLNPAFSLIAKPLLPGEPGPYEMLGLDTGGSELFRLSFAGEEVADGPDPSERHFAYFVPLGSAQLEALERIDLIGPEGRGTRRSLPLEELVPGLEGRGPEHRIEVLAGDRLRLLWDGEHLPMAMVRERSTGRILTFARGGEATVSAPGLGAGDLEVLLSDGVRSRAARRR